MAAIYQPICVLHRDSAAAAAGNNPGRAAGSERPDLLTGALAADPLGGASLLARLVELGPDVQVDHVELIPIGGGVTDDEPAMLIASFGDSIWRVITNFGQSIRVANTSACVLERSPTRVGASLVTEPLVSLVLDGVLAQWVTPPTSWSARVWVRPRNWSAATTTQHGIFYDPALTTAAELLEQQLTLLSTRAGSGWPVQLGKNIEFNATNYALDCVYASTGPDGAVWVDLSDIGVSTSESTLIPTELAANTAAAFQRYPSVFYRRPAFARGVIFAAPSLGDRESDDITTDAGVPTIYQTNVDLVASTWVLQIDGTAIIATISHAGVLGLRKPLDVWNLLIVPAIQRNQALDLWDGSDVVGKLGRLEWLECARFVEAFRTLDLSVRAFTPYAQVGMPDAP